MQDLQRLESIGRVDRVVVERGFPPLVPLDSAIDPRTVFGRARLAGVYVLVFVDGDYYVGETSHLALRLAAHRRRFDDLAWVSFKRMPRQRGLKRALREREREEIAALFHALDEHGIRSRGIAHVPRPTAQSDFDFLLDPADQDLWLQDVTHAFEDDSRRDDAPLRTRYADRFRTFADLPEADGICSVLQRYVQVCIPVPRAAESWFWNVSCMPGGSRDLLCRINVGWQTVVDVRAGGDSGPIFDFFVTLPLAERFLSTDLGPYNELDDEMDMVDSTGALLFTVNVFPVTMSRGGAQQVAIRVEGFSAAESMLFSSSAIQMLRHFALGLLKQGPCPWGGNHCMGLADRLLQPLFAPGK